MEQQNARKHYNYINEQFLSSYGFFTGRDNITCLYKKPSNEKLRIKEMLLDAIRQMERKLSSDIIICRTTGFIGNNQKFSIILKYYNINSIVVKITSNRLIIVNENGKIYFNKSWYFSTDVAKEIKNALRGNNND